MTERADVLIVGAGASGGVAALRLARAGLRVVCLEQGDWHDRAGYPGAGRRLGAAGPEAVVVVAERARSVDRLPDRLRRLRHGLGNFNGVGGGTVLYSAVWPRMLPSDFRTRTERRHRRRLAAHLRGAAAHYEETDRQFGVSGLGGNPMYPPGADPPLPPLPIGRAGLALARAHARLGWHWWPEYNAILSAEHDGRHVCVQRGTCGSGCNEGAKGSTDVTHWPQAVAAGAHLVTGARVRRIVVDGRGRAVRRQVARPRRARALPSGRRRDVRGERHRHCAAAPASRRTRAHPTGWRTRRGSSGRRLMVHPGVHRSTATSTTTCRATAATSADRSNSLEFARTDPSRGFVGGTTLEPRARRVGRWPPRSRPRPTRCSAPSTTHDTRSRFGRAARWVDPLRGPARARQPRRALGRPGRRRRASRRRGALPVERRQPAAMAWSTERAPSPWSRPVRDTIDTTTDAAERPPARDRPHGRRSRRRRSSTAGAWPTTCATSRSSTAASSSPRAPPTRPARSPPSPCVPSSTCSRTGRRAGPGTVALVRAVGVGRPRPVPVVEPTTVSLTITPTAHERDRLRTLAPPLPSRRRADARRERCGSRRRPPRRGAARPSRPRWRAATGARRGDHRSAGRHRRPPHADPPAYRALVLLVLAAYYRSPDVRARIGWPGPEGAPVGRFEYPEYLTEGLLDHLTEERHA